MSKLPRNLRIFRHHALTIFAMPYSILKLRGVFLTGKEKSLGTNVIFAKKSLPLGAGPELFQCQFIKAYMT